MGCNRGGSGVHLQVPTGTASEDRARMPEGVGGRKVMLNVSNLHWNQIVIEEQVEKNLVELRILTDSSKLVAEVVMIDVLFELVDGPFPC